MMKTIVMIVLVVIPRREEGTNIKRKDGTKNIRKKKTNVKGNLIERRKEVINDTVVQQAVKIRKLRTKLLLPSKNFVGGELNGKNRNVNDRKRYLTIRIRIKELDDTILINIIHVSVEISL